MTTGSARSGRGLEDVARRLDSGFPPLSRDERRVALSVVRELAGGRPASPGAVGRRARVPEEVVVEALGRWPGVYRDPAGNVVGFWGLALESMPHTVHVGGRALHAWCAWDTLFLGELLGETLRVESSCAVSDRPVTLLAGAEGVQDLDPADAVISFLDPERCDVGGDRVISSFCHHILFFASVDEWSGWASDRSPETFPLTVEEGWRLGRMCNRLRYGEVLEWNG